MRFVVLDGLRGCAALVVLISHLVQQHDVNELPYAGLAVDFFFMLSGFVVAFAYEPSLRSCEMSLIDFARVRAMRLYPLLVLGTSAGIFLAVLAAAFKGQPSFQDIAVSGALALLLLPSFVFPQWQTAYPFNMPAWSLTFEMFANLLYGAIAFRLTSSRLVMLTILSAILFAWLALANQGVGGGNNQDNFMLGFGRVMFPFFAGVLLYRLRLSQRPGPASAIFVIHVLTGSLLVMKHALPQLGGLTSLVYVLILFPLVITIGAAVEAGPRVAKLCTFAGQLSFPVYILQGPVIRIGDEILKHVHFNFAGACLFGFIEGFLVIAIAYAALKLYDNPIQVAFKSRNFAYRSRRLMS
jgi:peptidoglycan/LPS O-acetylase OafA/YrhL